MKNKIAHLSRQSHNLREYVAHPIHKEYRIKCNQYTNTIRSTKKQHWMDWLENISGNDLWVANKYIYTLAGANANTRILSLKHLSIDPSAPEATMNEEKVTYWLKLSFLLPHYNS